MSKKDNFKFKKRIKAQILREMTGPGAFDKPTPVATPATVDQPKIAVREEFQRSESNSDSLQLIRADLKKSAFIIGSIIVLIIAIYFIDQKTGFLLKSGEHLFQYLNISA